MEVPGMKPAFIIRVFVSVMGVFANLNLLLSDSHRVKEITAKPLTLPEGFTVTAHAGALSTLPNSLYSLTTAISAGIDVIEVDLNFRPDGTPVIVHNEPKSNFSGVLLSKALSKIAKSDTVLVNLDLKSASNLGVIEDMIKEYDGLIGRVFFTGISEEFLDDIRKHCPNIPYYLNYNSSSDFKNTPREIDEIVNNVIKAGAIGINMDSGNFTAELCSAMHERGLLVSVWTIDKTLDQYRILALSPDNITTKQPIKLKKIIEKWRG